MDFKLAEPVSPESGANAMSIGFDSIGESSVSGQETLNGWSLQGAIYHATSQFIKAVRLSWIAEKIVQVFGSGTTL